MSVYTGPVAAAPPQADASQVVELGTVAAANVAKAINAHPDAIPSIKKAIADEINAMSSHFTLAFADIQTQYEAAVYQAKLEYQKAIGAFNYVASNRTAVSIAGVVLLLTGWAIGRFVR